MIQRIPHQFIAERIILGLMDRDGVQSHVILLPGQEVTIRNIFRFVNETNFLIGVASRPDRDYEGGERIIVASALGIHNWGFEPEAADLKTFRIRSKTIAENAEYIVSALEARNFELQPGQFGRLNHDQALFFASQYFERSEDDE